MRAVVQRVSRASVRVAGEADAHGTIGRGVCVLLGVGVNDADADADKLANKVVNLRIFDDDEGKMNRSLLDVGGAALIVSQFTLYGDCRGGRRPSFIGAARSDEGARLYERFVRSVAALGVSTATGVFQTHMLVSIDNDGPVTLILDTKEL
ncbi:MAG: D-tyrosyl-tRNA(Tyr) deacylase [Synergistaceae bacterium]|jgi:D-tyrosyl-tRNA(Tyr) deacylase|nr:D-tyrosyl-tRNA(Tyr) deacylase [Synergistaceae bacterium]